jgi:hypothetical protein
MKTLFSLILSFTIFATFGQQKNSASVKRDTLQTHADTTAKKRVTKVVLAPPSKAWQRQSAIESLQKMVGNNIEYCIFFYGGNVNKHTGFTCLYFGASYPNQYLTVLIPKGDIGKFNYLPIAEFNNKELCIKGILTNNHGSMEIMVHDPKQLQVVYTSPYPIK